MRHNREVAETILIVDDDADIRRLLDLELRRLGYETVFARDAISAVSAARSAKPALVVLDIGLPGGDGYLVMKRLRAFAELEATPIVVLTAGTRPETRERALAEGASAFLEKPFDADELAAAIREHIRPEPASA